MKSLIFCLALVPTALAVPQSRAINPVVASSTVIGLVAAPGVNRDSCNSVRWGSTRVLWTCRDTQPVVNGVATLPIVSTTAAWSAFNADGTPNLVQSGPTSAPFYPLQADQCSGNTAGGCSDGTRWAIWEDTAPMITLSYPNGDIGGYTWISQQHINQDLSPVNTSPPASLFRVVYQPGTTPNNLPAVQLVQEGFWSSTEIPFGVYGTVIVSDVAYLYGRLSNSGTALAKVSINGVETKSNYQYWVNGAWTTTAPLRTASIGIPNVTAGGQGTFYYSSLWASYVWIGGNQYPGASFYITTAPAPQGPWTAPKLFYSGHGGSVGLGSYSLQAHPGLTTGTGRDVYLTFTNLTAAPGGTSLYTTSLIHVVWA